MGIELIDTITPKNNGSFPMVNAKDVDVDGVRLPEKLEELAAGGNVESATDSDISNLFRLGDLTVSVAPRTGGQTVLVAPAMESGNMLRYLITDSDKTPVIVYDQPYVTANGWTGLPGNGEVSGAEGQVITVVEMTEQGAKARKAGSAVLPAPLA
ncbi:hypothetical protein EMO89_02750 [Bifidobacterium tissieri]|uniref:Uncharacterized protein n=1 Tax=Bifidobacterium tissieri TaxID=1630162 RepID=A0A5M9ZW18_9BIFI|nr:hypothetical protein [Bifidobacterium tissieri]KAA8831659.1 hypothetical protein EMO89_02750 [Bifidobacterium tissieri]